jgi:hypothetical protein
MIYSAILAFAFISLMADVAHMVYTKRTMKKARVQRRIERITRDH